MIILLGEDTYSTRIYHQ